MTAPLRSALLWASENPFVARRVPRYGFVRRAVRRFMPGEEPTDALREAERLGSGGVWTVVTHLGENVANATEASAVVDRYLNLIGLARGRGVDLEISVKLTQLGLDQGVEIAARHALELAEASDGILWIDMESSPYVDRTLEVYRRVRAQREDVGICLQAYLRRTEDDLAELMPLTPHVRLVKGAYLETPEVAYAKKSQVDARFRMLASSLLRERARGRAGRPAIATHDGRLVGDAQRVAYELGLGTDAWEVQMLYGIATAQQERLVRGGTPLRVLISYGSHWFPWYMRRLAERPANLGFVLKQIVAR